jgi:hypothetical protein
MSLKPIKKDFQLAGKGDNEILEIFNLLMHTTAVTAAAGGHVPGNGGTCD